MYFRVRLLLLASVLLLTSLATCIPVVWSKEVKGSTNSHVLRDPSGSVYHVASRPFLQGRSIEVTRYSSLGATNWTQTYLVNAPIGIQFFIRGLALSGDYLFVLVQERTSNGFDFSGSRLLTFNRLSGAIGPAVTSTQELVSLAVGNGQVCVAGSDPISFAGSISFYSDVLVPLGTVDIGNVILLSNLVMDSTNNAYVGNGYGRMVKCSVAQGLIFNTAFDVPQYIGEQAERVAVDELANRFYAIGGALRDSNFNRDVLCYVLDATTGAIVNSSPVLVSEDTDFINDLTVFPNEGVAASAYPSSRSGAAVSRISSSGILVWSVMMPSPAWEVRQLLDLDGNLMVCTSGGAPNLRIARLHRNTGADLGFFDSPVSASPNTTSIASDPAGVVYVTVNNYPNTALFRIQPATLSIPTTIAVGGNVVNAEISLAAPAGADQTWTIASSNSNIVSVPSSVVASAGASSATFPLTIQGVAANTSVTINVRHNGFISQRSITVVPSRIQSVSVTPQVVIGGGSTTAILNLSGTAPTGGQTVNLFSSKPAVASVPATAIVPAGQSTHGVMVTTFGVNANQGVVITATTGAVSKTAFFAVNAPSLTSISIFPTTIQGGQTATLTMNINGIAPEGGFSIVLFSGAPGIVFAPAAAPVLAGQTTRNVDLPTAPVTSSTNVLIFATRSGIYRTATLTVTP